MDNFFISCVDEHCLSVRENSSQVSTKEIIQPWACFAILTYVKCNGGKMCFEKVHFKDQAKSNSIATLKLETGADTSFGSVSCLRDLLRPEDVHRLNNDCQVTRLLSTGALLTTVCTLLNISSKAPLNAKLKKNKEKKHCSLLSSLQPENSLVSEGQSSLIQIPTVYCEAFFASS